MIETLLLFAA